MGILLLMTRQEDWATGVRTPKGLEKLAMVVFLGVVAANAVQAFASTGPPPFVGQSDPVRFSFSPRHWTWSLQEWVASPISLRGRWRISKPAPSRVDPAPDAGPFSGLQGLALLERRRLTLPLRGGSPTGLAYDSGSDRFAVSTESGIHITDGSLSRVTRYTVVDPNYSADIGRLADLAFLDSHTIVGVGENKSYVTLRENDHADGAGNYRFFLESPDRFDELCSVQTRAWSLWLHGAAQRPRRAAGWRPVAVRQGSGTVSVSRPFACRRAIVRILVEATEDCGGRNEF